MKKLILFLALFPLLAMGGGQTVMTGNHRHVFASGSPTFKQYTYQVGPTTPSVSKSITVSTGDLIVVDCRFDAASTISVSATGATMGTWSGGTIYGPTSSAGVAMFAALVTSGAATTFTCTGGTGYNSIIVLDYSSTLSSVTLLANTGFGSSINFTTATVSSISTSAKSLVVMCAAASSSSYAWTAGTINGNAATLRGVDYSSTASNATAGCEDSNSLSSMSGATATMTYGGNYGRSAGVLAIAY